MKYHWMGYDLLLDKKGNVKIIEYSCNVRTKGAEQGGYDIRKRQMEYMVNYLKFSISN